MLSVLYYLENASVVCRLCLYVWLGFCGSSPSDPLPGLCPYILHWRTESPWLPQCPPYLLSPNSATTGTDGRPLAANRSAANIKLWTPKADQPAQMACRLTVMLVLGLVPGFQDSLWPGVKSLMLALALRIQSLLTSCWLITCRCLWHFPRTQCVLQTLLASQSLHIQRLMSDFWLLIKVFFCSREETILRKIQ